MKKMLELVDSRDYVDFEENIDDNTGQITVSITDENFRKILYELQSLMRYRHIARDPGMIGLARPEPIERAPRVQWNEWQVNQPTFYTSGTASTIGVINTGNDNGE